MYYKCGMQTVPVLQNNCFLFTKVGSKSTYKLKTGTMAYNKNNWVYVINNVMAMFGFWFEGMALFPVTYTQCNISYRNGILLLSLKLYENACNRDSVTTGFWIAGANSIWKLCPIMPVVAPVVLKVSVGNNEKFPILANFFLTTIIQKSLPVSIKKNNLFLAHSVWTRSFPATTQVCRNFSK